MGEKDAWLSAMRDFRPMGSNLVKSLWDGLFGSHIYVDGERLDVYRLLVAIESTQDFGGGEKAIIDAMSRLGYAHCSQREVTGNEIGKWGEMRGVREGGAGGQERMLRGRMAERSVTGRSNLVRRATCDVGSAKQRVLKGSSGRDRHCEPYGTGMRMRNQ
jgi:hypothetical protein